MFVAGYLFVSPATTPDLLPIMKKCSAIVSEQGGVICHASITSRELKIPCVVGVKGATKVLKDGDLVEVDADNGVVRILERAQQS
jgi:pyruvate, water dikinase